MQISRRSLDETLLALKYSAVACLGFVTDAVLLKLGVHLGLTPAVARAVSLPMAMQVTFWVNGTLVFRCLELRRLPMHWLGYMASNGLGNLCNYFVFVALMSLHHPLLSRPLIALSGGAFMAWAINYASLRFLVFGSARPTPGQVAHAPVWCGPFGHPPGGQPPRPSTPTPTPTPTGR